jgi:vacuolar-type H+-ATPase subunit E/Vma4
MRLDPYREARLAEARQRADALVAAAQAEGAARIGEASQQGEALVRRAREEGMADAEHETGLEAARARWRMRETVLRARREAYDELGRQVRTAALGLRTQPGYALLLRRLSALARRRFGSEARIERDPDGVGGVIAEADGRWVDYSLPALADRCLEDLGDAVERLWR